MSLWRKHREEVSCSMDIEEQEAIAKSRFNPRAALFSGLVAGAVFLILSRGFPWISSGVPEAAMGRPLVENVPQGGFLLISLVQMGLALAYSFVVGLFVYRFDPLAAVMMGAVAGTILYFANFLVFRVMLQVGEEGEISVLMIHIIFCMLAASLYKAFSVEKSPDRPSVE